MHGNKDPGPRRAAASGATGRRVRGVDGRARRASGASGARRQSEERSSHEPVHLADDLVRELEAMARPGKGPILVKVFSEAAGAFAAGDFRESARLADQAKHIALRAPAVRELLGLALYRAGRWKEAARELGAYRRLTGSTEQNPVLADCHRALGNPRRAVQLCDEVDRARVDEATFFEGAIVAAGALGEMGSYDEAIRRLESLDLDPPTAREHHLRAWYALADLLEGRGRFTQARSLFGAVAAADPDATDAPERARRLVHKG